MTVSPMLILFAKGSARAQGVVLPLPPEDQQTITAQLGSRGGRKRAAQHSDWSCFQLLGMVAMIMQEDVSAFWIYNIDSTVGKVLMTR